MAKQLSVRWDIVFETFLQAKFAAQKM